MLPKTSSKSTPNPMKIISKSKRRFGYVLNAFWTRLDASWTEKPSEKKPVLARNGKRAKIKHRCPASDQISPKPPAPNLEHLTSSAQPRHLQGSAQPLPRNWFPICGLRPRFARPRPRRQGPGAKDQGRGPGAPFQWKGYLIIACCWLAPLYPFQCSG